MKNNSLVFVMEKCEWCGKKVKKRYRVCTDEDAPAHKKHDENCETWFCKKCVDEQCEPNIYDYD